MTKHLDRSINSNVSDNPSIGDLIQVAVTRRSFLQAGIVGAIGALPGAALLGGCAAPTAEPPLGFAAVAPSTEDRVVVPPGYRVQVLYRWGDPVGAPAGMPPFRMDASNTAEEQALQAGMHHDAIEYFPLPRDSLWCTPGGRACRAPRRADCLQSITSTPTTGCCIPTG
jgi:secreted PhoX family phosphatase